MISLVFVNYVLSYLLIEPTAYLDIFMHIYYTTYIQVKSNPTFRRLAEQYSYCLCSTEMSIFLMIDDTVMLSLMLMRCSNYTCNLYQH